jgi:hypothetical protein
MRTKTSRHGGTVSSAKMVRLSFLAKRDREVDAFNEGGIDLPALRGQHLRDPSQGPEYHPVTYVHQPTAAILLDDLGIVKPGQGHPARLRGMACGLTTWRLYPLAKVGHQCRGVFSESIGEKQGHTVGSQDLHDLMDQALRRRCQVNFPSLPFPVACGILAA